jgi:hypothetical protein
MRAKFVNEIFTEDGDPISDMRIGYPKKQVSTKAWRILDFIKNKGEEGASFTEIQHFIWTKLKGLSDKSFWKKEKTWSYNYKTGRDYPTTIRATRGIYCTNLYGTEGNYWATDKKPGLLHKYCKKNDKGKWVLVRMPKPYEAFYK